MSSIEHGKEMGERPARIRLRLLALFLVIIVPVTLFVPYAGASVSTRHSSIAGNQAGVFLPTSTATVTLARSTPLPQRPASSLGSIPGQPQVDFDTVALYHFDSSSEMVAVDATGKFTGTFYGNATVTSSGVYAGALRLDGTTGYVSTGSLGPLDQGTIEAFVDFGDACNSPNDAFPIITVMGSSGPVLVLEENSGLHFGIYANGQWNWADSGINSCRYLKSGNTFNPFPWENVPVLWPYETWRFHHIAVTWGARGMEIWVDGVLHGVGNDDPNANLYPYPYMCNPQDQEMSSLYPACKTPVMAPTMPAYPRGDYTGTLPGYNSFLIGYNPYLPTGTTSNPYFKGRIDEVRISNIQRTFAYTVVPTLTPVPTQTPVPILGEYVVDSNTVALFHLNFQNTPKVLEEVTQEYKYIEGQASIVPNGRFSGGLSLDGSGSYLNAGNLTNFNNGTVETWINLSPQSNKQSLFAARQYYNSSNSILEFGISPQGAPYFGLADDTGFHQISGQTVPLNGCWHHLAGTWGSRGLELWVDGTLSSTNTAYTGGMIGQVYDWRIGCDYAGFCTKGILDEVRVSKIQRTFTPFSQLQRSGRMAPGVTGSPVFLPMIQVSPPQSNCPFG